MTEKRQRSDPDADGRERPRNVGRKRTSRSVPPEEAATPEQVFDALKSLSRKEKQKLFLGAKRYWRNLPAALQERYPPDELTQEAFYRALSGRRRWPWRRCDFKTFLIQTVRSIVSSLIKQWERGTLT